MNFNNYLYATYEALHNSAIVGTASTGQLVDTFYTNPDPPATWEQMLGTITPLLAIFSAGLSGIGALATSTLVAVVGGVIETAEGDGVTETQLVVERLFTEFPPMDVFIKQFLQTTANGADPAWEQYIGNASAASWFGSDVLSADDPNRYGIFGTGHWVDQDTFNTPGMQMTMLDNFVRIISYKSINYAWNDSQAFTIYALYNTPVKDQTRNMQKSWNKFGVVPVQRIEDRR